MLIVCVLLYIHNTCVYHYICVYICYSIYIDIVIDTDISMYVCVFTSLSYKSVGSMKTGTFFFNCNSSSHEHSRLIAGSLWYTKDYIGKKEGMNSFFFFCEALGLVRSSCCWYR